MGVKTNESKIENAQSIRLVGGFASLMFFLSVLLFFSPWLHPESIASDVLLICLSPLFNSKTFFLLRPIDFAGKDGSKVTTVVATPGQGPDRPQEVSYSDTKVIGNGSFGVVFQAKLCDTGELVAIKKVLQDKRFKVSEK